MIRAGTMEDLEALVEGNISMARETEGLALDPETVREGVRAALAGEVNATYRILERSGRVMAQLMITTEWSDWRATRVWWIQSVYVWPEGRRQGAYRALYEQVLQEAREAGAGGVRLYVDNRNGGARETYSVLGMDGGHYQVFEQMFNEPPGVN